MKKNVIMVAITTATMSLMACGSTKSVVNQGYNNSGQDGKQQSFMVKQQTREVDKLVAQETNRMRAVGIGNDYDEKLARREAQNDAKNTLAGYIETSVVALTSEYTKKTTINKKKISESNIEGMVETSVAQKVSTRMIGVPEVYNVSDGSIQVYVCLELVKPTEEILGEVYDDLSKDDVLGVDYDKQKFISDNKDRIQELREKVK